MRRALRAGAIGLLAGAAIGAAGAGSAQGARVFVGSGNVAAADGASFDWQWSLTNRVALQRRSVHICTRPGTRLHHPERTDVPAEWQVASICAVFPMRGGRVVMNGLSEARRRVRTGLFLGAGGIYHLDNRPWYEYKLYTLIARPDLTHPRVAVGGAVLPLRRAGVVAVGRDRLRLWMGLLVRGSGDHCAMRVTAIRKVGGVARRVVLVNDGPCGPLN